MSSTPNPQSPVNPVPPVVGALFLLIMGVEVMFYLGEQGIIGGPGAIGWRNGAVQDYGFNTRLAAWMFETGVVEMDHLKRYVTYPFVHGGFIHALFAGAMVLALGKFVGEVFAQWAVLVLFLSSCIVGALVYMLVAPGQPWLYGAYPGVYGLIGGFTYLIWLRLGQLGEAQYRAFTLIGFLMGVQLLFGLIFGSDSMWIADIAGFVAGFGASFALSPGGWARVLAALRRGDG